MQVVVLGMHRSGTSATTGVLNALGVHVGERLLMKGRMNDAHYEDRDFLRTNESILRRLGGRWDDPPRIEAIEKARTHYDAHIRQLIKRKDKRRLWGWKDPRTCLTATLYVPHLSDPRYIYVMREEDATVDSLIRRSGRDVEFWRRLRTHYITCVVKFLHGKKYLRVWYEDLTNKATAQDTVKALNDYVGGNGNVKAALSRVRFKE